MAKIVDEEFKIPKEIKPLVDVFVDAFQKELLGGGPPLCNIQH